MSSPSPSSSPRLEGTLASSGEFQHSTLSICSGDHFLHLNFGFELMVYMLHACH